MLIKLVLMLFLGSAAFAGEFIDNWPRGKTERLSYEITVFSPSESKNYIQSQITRSKNAKDIFDIKQTMDIPGQSVKIVSTDKYEAPALRLISSVNRFGLPAEITEQLGVDTLDITARPLGDSLEIRSNADIIPSEKIAFPADYVTSTGSQLVSRNMDFTVGHVTKRAFINLLTIGGLEFAPVVMVDSVMGREKVTISLGTFDCFKVKNTATGITGYSYYTSDPRHIPVKIDLIDPAGGNITMSITLLKYQ